MQDLFIIFSIAAFVLGIIIGSFLNVVILRYKTGRGISGRSFCLSCGKILKSIDLIPLFSFIFLKGKCRHCHSPISWQYFVVELVTGLVFLFTFLKISSGVPLFNYLSLFYYLVIFSILIVISVYDIRHTIIPDCLSYIFSGLALVGLLATKGTDILYFPQSLDFFAGPILFAPFFLLWFFSEGRWMGLGDGKLALGVGWLLGLASGVSAIIIGFWSGALYSLGLLLYGAIRKSRKVGLKTEVPFAPFIIFGVFLSFYFNLDILNLKVILDLLI